MSRRRDDGDWVDISLQDDTRAIQWSLQAFFAVLILMVGLSLAVDAVASGSEQETEAVIESQKAANAGDILSTSDNTGDLKEALLHWDARPGEGRWIDAEVGGPSTSFYTQLPDGTGPAAPHPLSAIIREVNTDGTDSINIVVEYQADTDGDGTLELASQRILYQGSPGPNSIRTSRTIVLTDSDSVQTSSGSSDGDECTLGEIADTTDGECDSDTYFAPDTSGGSRYNVVEVSVTIW
jgi:hypothetical protein